MAQTPAAQTDPKLQLADLMDAYGAAKLSANETLQRLIVGQVQMFLQSHDITPISERSVATPPPAPAPPASLPSEVEDAGEFGDSAPKRTTATSRRTRK
jgi:hypothetical protein